MMETTIYKFENDIDVFCVKAKSFPEGVSQAHEALQKLIPFNKDRKYFGISRPENGQGIVYRAGATELTQGELKKYNLEKFTVKKGNYLCTDIRGFMKKLASIGLTFQQMLKDPLIDPQGACVEWYMNDTDCKCMVRLK